MSPACFVGFRRLPAASVPTPSCCRSYLDGGPLAGVGKKYISTCKPVHIDTYLHVYIHTYLHIYMYTYIHTYM